MVMSSDGVASHLVGSCLLHLSKISKATGKNVTYQSSLQREIGPFKLWAYGFDAWPDQVNADGEAVNYQLDVVLDNSKYLKEPTIMLLSTFASCLLLEQFERLGDDATREMLGDAIQSATEVYSQIGSGCWDVGSEQTQGSAVEELHDVVNSLFQLAPSLNEVMEGLRVSTDLRLPPVTASYQNIILTKFPNARQHLVLRCAKGNTECHKLLRLEVGETTGHLVGLGSSASKQMIGRDIIGCVQSQTQAALSVPGPSEIASHLQGTTFHDSGLGSSVPFLMAPAPSISVFSVSTTSALGERPPIPGLPKDSGSRTGFLCPLCRHIQAPIYHKPRAHAQWRKHVFSDIKPYMCIYEDCPVENSFKSQGECIAHQSLHKSSGDFELSNNSCPFCLKLFESNQERNFYSHVGHHMEDIRLFSLPPSHRQQDGPYDSRSDLDNSSDTQDSGNIPLDGRGEPSNAEVETSPESTAATKAFREHLRTHQSTDREKFVGYWLGGAPAPVSLVGSSIVEIRGTPKPEAVQPGIHVHSPTPSYTSDWTDPPTPAPWDPNSGAYDGRKRFRW